MVPLCFDDYNLFELEQRTAGDRGYKALLVLLRVSGHTIVLIKVLMLIWHQNK